MACNDRFGMRMPHFGLGARVELQRENLLALCAEEELTVGELASLLDYLASKNDQLETLPAMYGNTPIGIAMAKGDPALLKFVNGFVSDYIKSGAYAANYKKWWGAKAVPPTLAP